MADEAEAASSITTSNNLHGECFAKDRHVWTVLSDERYLLRKRMRRLIEILNNNSFSFIRKTRHINALNIRKLFYSLPRFPMKLNEIDDWINYWFSIAYYEDVNVVG